MLLSTSSLVENGVKVTREKDEGRGGTVASKGLRWSMCKKGDEMGRRIVSTLEMEIERGKRRRRRELTRRDDHLAVCPSLSLSLSLVPN